MHRRRPIGGFTLIELLTVTTLTSVLMLVAVMLLRGMLDWGNTSAADTSRASSIDRMEQELRRQLRAASKINLANQALTIDYDGKRAVWTLTDNACQLTVNGGDLPRRERFVIGPVGAWQLDINDQFAEVRIDRPQLEKGMPFSVVVARSTVPPESEP